MMNKNILGYSLSGFNWLIAALSTNVVYQAIEIVLAVISTLVTLSFTIWKWYKAASKDGEITNDEVKNLVDDIKKGDDENGDNL